MSIDRRIVSILYHNGIFDIEDVEKFVGEKDNYYEIIIDGELKKLKIPGKQYSDDTEITTEFEYEELPEKEKFSQITFEEELLEAEKDAKNENLFTVTEVSFEEEMKKSDDENDLFLEKINKEEEVLLNNFNEQLKKPSKIPKSKTVEKKEKKVVSKKDIDDFMDTI